MVSLAARRPTLLSAPAVVDLASSVGAFSPLDQVKLGVQPVQPEDIVAAPSKSEPTPAPIPSLDLNLFRTPSVYSVDSSFDSSSSDGYSDEGYGFGFTSEPEDGIESDATDDTDVPLASSLRLLTNALQLEHDDHVQARAVSTPTPKSSSPATPRARRTASRESMAGTVCGSGATTPTHEMQLQLQLPVSREGSLRVRGPATHPNIPYGGGAAAAAALSSAISNISNAPFHLQPVPRMVTARSMSGNSGMDAGVSPSPMPRSCSEPVPHSAPAPSLPQHNVVSDTASLHGEQGSDWGDDENGFEWLDNDGSPAATNGVTSSSSAGARVTRRPSLLSLSPRLARFRVGGSSASVPAASERPRVVTAPAASASGSESERTGDTAPLVGGRKKKRTIILPRRAAPPPPTSMHGDVSPSAAPSAPSAPSAPTAAPVSSFIVRSRSTSRNTPPRHTPSPEDTEIMTPNSIDPRGAVSPLFPPPHNVAAHSLSAHNLTAIAAHNASGANLLRSASQASYLPTAQDAKTRTHAGDANPYPYPYPHPHPPPAQVQFNEPPRAGSGSSGEDDARSLRGSGARSPHSPPVSSMNIDGRSADELVSAGHARRNAGDLPKSAWLFMKAAEAGSATGSIHYGLALRHGLGVARDERRGVAELTAAVGHSVADAGIDLRAAASTGTILPLAQSRAFAKDTALALVELGACALEGAGQPRSPDAALEALRMAACLGDASAQEQLGYLLSKGASSVRKDMREAAMWYRAALDGGANIPGIAWVWKEKYGK